MAIQFIITEILVRIYSLIIQCILNDEISQFEVWLRLRIGSRGVATVASQ